MSYFKTTRPTWMIYAVALSGLVFTVGAIKIIEYDVWWHLTTGWVILNLGQIPRNDIFSYSAFGAPWFNHEWLFQIMQWLVYDNGGVAALTVMKLLLVTATTWLLFTTISLVSSSRSAALWGSMIFLWASAYRILDRPFLVGMVLLAAFCLILHKYVQKGTRAIWALPPLMIFWVNIHGGSLLGLEVVFAFAIGESLQAFAEKKFSGPESLPAKSRSLLWIIALLCTLACIINPWGFDAFIFPFKHMQMSSILAHTLEWLPVLHPHLDGLIPPLIALGWFLLTAISFVFNAKKARVSHLILFIITAMLLPKGHRFVPEFLIVNIPVAFYNFKSAVIPACCKRGSPKDENRGYIYSWIQIAIAGALSAMVMLFGVPIKTNGEMMNWVGIGTVQASAPAKLVDFLEYYKIHGNVYNEMGTGGYLIFRRWPNERVFIDGRTPVYGDDFYMQFVDSLRNQRNFEELDKRWHFDYLVLTPTDAVSEKDFHRYIWQNRNWRLVYFGCDGLIYLRNEPKFRSLIRRLELKKNPLVEMFNVANFQK